MERIKEHLPLLLCVVLIAAFVLLQKHNREQRENDWRDGYLSGIRNAMIFDHARKQQQVQQCQQAAYMLYQLDQIEQREKETYSPTAAEVIEALEPPGADQIETVNGVRIYSKQ